MKKKYILIHIILYTFIIIIPFIFFQSIWYPQELSQLTDKNNILKIFLSIEIFMFFSLVGLFLLTKNRNTGKFSYLLLIVIQLVTAFFGYRTLFEARPIYISYEFDRFRVVRFVDIHWNNIAPEYNLFKGPRLVSVKKIPNSDMGFLNSIKDSIGGFHPSFKAERLTRYSYAKELIIKNAKPISLLKQKDTKAVFNKITQQNLDISDIGYYPLVSNDNDEWIVIVNINTAEVVCYLDINGWNDGGLIYEKR